MVAAVAVVAETAGKRSLITARQRVGPKGPARFFACSIWLKLLKTLCNARQYQAADKSVPGTVIERYNQQRDKSAGKSMSKSTQPVILYGVPFSQPVRAVMWLMLYKRTPFEMVLINPGSKGETGSRNPAYLAKNPGGTIPTIEEPDTGFVLGEAHAILCYLSNRHGWDDVYPKDHQSRARVDWYLHYHHRNVRDASLGLVAPKIRKDLDIPEDNIPF